MSDHIQTKTPDKTKGGDREFKRLIGAFDKVHKERECMRNSVATAQRNGGSPDVVVAAVQACTAPNVKIN